MAILYPTQKDNFPNPNSTSVLGNPSHIVQHSDLNDAVEALETKVGIDGSADTNSIDYKIADRIVGPATSTIDDVAVFADTTGKVLKDSPLKTINGNSLLGSGNIAILGSGDVVGPASSTDESIARFDGVTGKLLQDGGNATLDDAGEITCTGVFIDTDSDNNSAQFGYGYGFNPLESEYYNKKARIESFLESPFFSAGIARNYLLQTEAFGTTWVNTGGTLTSNDATLLAPNGSATAEKIVARTGFATDNIVQTITNSTTGFWSAGLWLRVVSGTGTVALVIDSGGTGGGESGTPKTCNLDEKWRFFAVTQNFVAAHTTKSFKITYGETSIQLWGARMNPGASCNAYRVNTTSAQTTITPGIFFNNTNVYATNFIGALTGSCTSSSLYSTRGIYFGNTLTDGVDKTDKWMYFGNQTISYNVGYLGGNSWNEDVILDELSNNTNKNESVLEKVRLTLRGYIQSYANTTEFNAAVPDISVELSGSNLVITKDDIAAIYYSSSTSTKVIRYYVRLKDDNTHYNITPIAPYGASYTTAGTIINTINTFTPVASSATIAALPTPVSGSAVYATDANLEIGSIQIKTGASAGKILQSDANGVATWETATIEGTAVKSTGEAGGTKFLREDGDGTCSWQSTPTGGTPTQITVANEATDTTCFPLFVTAATGDLGPKTVASLTLNSNTGLLSATGLAGAFNGSVGATTPSTIVGTTVQANTGFVPDANDGAYLGTSALGFSDLFLAEGGVINWDNGDLTLTQTGNSLKISGGDFTLDENTSIALDPAGSADGKYSGITVTGTSGYTQAFGDLVTLDKDDSRWEAVDISVAAAATGDARGILGMVVVAGNDGAACTILLQGIIRADANFPPLTIGAAVYASTTGDIVVAQPTTTDYVIRIVGSALTADEIYFNPDYNWITHT